MHKQLKPNNSAPVVFIPPGTNQSQTMFCSKLVQGTEQNLTVVVGEGASVDLCDDTKIKSVSYFVHAHAQLRVVVPIVDAAQKTISINCLEESARADCDIIYLLNNNQRCTIRTEQQHTASHSTSRLSLRGVLTGCAQFLHSGLVSVAAHAHKTMAAHHNKTILLSPRCRVDSSPELAVHNKNVRCSHGSAVGQLDREQLFYLFSRGLCKPDAVQLALHAFLGLSSAWWGATTKTNCVPERLMDRLQELVNEKSAQRFSDFRSKAQRPSSHLF